VKDKERARDKAGKADGMIPADRLPQIQHRKSGVIPSLGHLAALAATMRASSVRLSTLGTTSAASTPRITMTTMISISVNPRARAAVNRIDSL